ncbi:MAG TPA: hypothetical protein VF659_09400 [Pyrinomonadaceae bacterium]
MKHKFLFKSLTKQGGKAQFTLMLPFGGGPLSMDALMREEVLAQIALAAAEPGRQTESLGVGLASQYGAQPARIDFDTVNELLPKPEDYYRKDYRALSATLAPCYGLDFSTAGVLEKAVGMLKGQTVYTDHYYYSVHNWVGVVEDAKWDGGDEAGKGVPGINATLKLDSKKDPMLVRGVAMEPPAVHSCSVTVLFEFEFSHPDLVEEGRFWQLLGEEVGGQIVRLVVTAILGFWEISFVFQGAQEENKQIPAPAGAGDAGVTDADADMGRRDRERLGASPEQQREGRTTVIVSNERKTALGITAEGNNIPDEQVLAIVDGLVSQAAAGRVLLDGRRAECKRLATLATLGSAEGQLAAPLATLIDGASGETLEGLITMYSEQATARFGATCPQCHTAGLTIRSSVEDTLGQPAAGNKPPAPSTSSTIF